MTGAQSHTSVSCDWCHTSSDMLNP